MKKSIYKITFFVFAFCFLLTIQKTFAQKQKSNFFSKPEKYNGVINPIVCPAGTESSSLRVPPPSAYYGAMNKNGEKSATFVVTYNGFTTEAQATFQKAVDIWSSILKSDVTIYVNATWSALGNGVLGGASPSTFYRNFNGAPKLFTWYPTALAEKLARTTLNAPGEADINASFSSGTNWYYGLDGNPLANQYDLLSVVLHELGHGLGFIALTSYDNGIGTLQFENSASIYSEYMENQSGQNLLDASVFPNASTQLGNAFKSPIFFNSPFMVAQNNGNRSELYTPTVFSSGSSISHLGESYNGSIDALMTFSIAPGESILSPGPIVLNMFADMGWVNTYIIADTIKNSEQVISSVTVKAKVVSDSVLNVGSIKLHFSADSFKLDKQEVVMTATGVANEYSGVIPTPNSGKAYAYYVSAKDNTNKEYFAPGKFSEFINFGRENYFYFYMGTDNTPPNIAHESITELPIAVTDTTILAEVTDVFGVDTVYVEYQINNVVKPPFGLKLVPNEFNLYSGKFQFPAGTVSANDIVKYKIVAKDNSNAKNTAFSPASGFHQFTVIGNSAIQDTYSNNFNTASNDFFGSYYSITTPSGFANAAIHTKHPYDNGSGANNQSNYIYQFKIPIRIAAENAFMKFKEIALVEPGEPGSVFGTDEFYDYVIVEGSKDNGITWRILLNGYDCRAQSAWDTRWRSAVNATNGNSTATGDPTLYKDRSINLKPTFATNDVILLRFRLFADQGAYGWGWAIDDLEIQTPVAGLENLLDGDKLVKVYPNPTREILNIDTEFKFAVKKVEVQVTDLAGKPIRSQLFDNNKPVFKEQMNLKGLSAGMYLVNIKVGNQSLIRRIMIQ